MRYRAEKKPVAFDVTLSVMAQQEAARVVKAGQAREPTLLAHRLQQGGSGKRSDTAGTQTAARWSDKTADTAGTRIEARRARQCYVLAMMCAGT